MVAQVIPTVVVRVMAGTHGVDIEFFHHFDILQHTFGRNHITAVRVHFVTVGSFEEYLVAVFQCSGQRVEIRRFSSPFRRIGDG